MPGIPVQSVKLAGRGEYNSNRKFGRVILRHFLSMALRIEHFPLQVALVSLYRPFRDELGLNHVCLYAPAVPQLGPFYGHLARWLTVNVRWCEVASLLP